MIKLELINQGNLSAPDSNLFQQWCNQVATKLKVKGDICIKIVDDIESQDLNHTYRGQAKSTNVLSFPSELPVFVESTHLGDLAICAAVVISEAADQNKLIEHHWAHMSIHGLLHLLGYDHTEVDDAEEMEALEVELLSELGVSNPYLSF